MSVTRNVTLWRHDDLSYDDSTSSFRTNYSVLLHIDRVGLQPVTVTEAVASFWTVSIWKILLMMCVVLEMDSYLALCTDACYTTCSSPVFTLCDAEFACRQADNQPNRHDGSQAAGARSRPGLRPADHQRGGGMLQGQGQARHPARGLLLE